MIEIVLQPPALEPRPAVGKDRDHIVGFDADVALRVGHQGGRGGDLGPQAAGADVRLFGAGVEPAGLAAAGAEEAASGVPVTGFGTGFTTNPCQR